MSTDNSDVTWTSVNADSFTYYVLYVQRDLTWWEWVLVKVFGRSDPRILTAGKVEDS